MHFSLRRSNTTVGVFRSGSTHAFLGSGDDDTVQSRLDRNGFGYYQIILVLGIGVFTLSESIEMGAVAPLHTGLARTFKMTTAERASLPACVYAGSMVGMILAGPFGDLFGRRGTLIFGILCMLLSSMMLANVPSWTPIWILLWLRVLGGFAGAVGGPAAIALAVESCSSASRVGIMFAVMFFNSLGYLCEAVGLSIFMPEFGEGIDDSWRGLSYFIAFPALVSFPLMLLLRESPSLLAVKGRFAECTEALSYMARWNGRQPTLSANIVADSMVTTEQSGSNLLAGIACVFRSYLPLMCLFLVIDASRSFFMSGSAYLCKDLFMMTGSLMTPSAMNIVASVTPLVGILIGSRFVFMGVRLVTFLCCIIASTSLAILTLPSIRDSALMLLTCVLFFKLTYGPISTCVGLMRVEAFPTEVRATAFGIVSVAGKLLCMLGPILVESLKGSARAESWQNANLNIYLCSLAIGALVCGVLSLFVPAKMGNGRKLHDFLVAQNGKCFNMLDEHQEEALLLEDDHFRSKNTLNRRVTYGSIVHGEGTRGMPSRID